MPINKESETSLNILDVFSSNRNAKNVKDSITSFKSAYFQERNSSTVYCVRLSFCSSVFTLLDLFVFIPPPTFKSSLGPSPNPLPYSFLPLPIVTNSLPCSLAFLPPFNSPFEPPPPSPARFHPPNYCSPIPSKEVWLTIAWYGKAVTYFKR